MDLDGIFDLLELVVDIIDLATDSSREKRYFEQEKYRKERQQEQVNWSRFNGLSEDVSVVDNELPRLRTERYVTPTSRTQMLAPEVSEPERTPRNGQSAHRQPA